MNITLRAGERLYLNGAVIRLDRKATIELLNDAAFLLETHVIQASEATTTLRARSISSSRSCSWIPQRRDRRWTCCIS